ncbi:MAG: RNA 3'-terminal phosphate cyclase [Thermodesulfovibrionales bacterium]|nr:RNA 3'-terminal phosphate cyclase [Thermodesulfovibrionales bacterium]
MIEIDGSFGEGGGQILRTALSLSCLLNKPFRIVNIRKGRKNPGLMPQHLTSVKALQLLSDAAVSGDYKGSTELTFSPRKIREGDFSFDIGTAGSTMLVLQTAIPALMRADRQSSLMLRGGTHVPFSPSFHYVSEVFAPVIARIGVNVKMSIESYGFYPKGGGIIRADIMPANKLRPLRIPQRGRILRINGYSRAVNLPLSIAERQKNSALERISSGLPDLSCPVDIEAAASKAFGTGTFIFIKAESEHSIAGFTCLGERGKKAESVGEDAAIEFIEYYRSDGALDPYLSDQIVLYLSMCEGESIFTTSRITDHLMTNLWVIGLFHQFEWFIEGEKGKPGRVAIWGNPPYINRSI